MAVPEINVLAPQSPSRKSIRFPRQSGRKSRVFKFDSKSSIRASGYSPAVRKEKEKIRERTRSIMTFRVDQSATSSGGTHDPHFRFSIIAKAAKAHYHKIRQTRVPKGKKHHDYKPYVEYLSRAKLDHLKATVKQLMTPGLGILAADDSVRQLGNRLKELNLENTEINRRHYHEMLFGGEADTIALKECFSGVLMREESITQILYRGKKLTRMIKERNILLGVRFDKGVERLDGTEREYISYGLDTLSDTCKKLREKGAKFGLWRCVFRVSEVTPSKLALVENSITLAKFAVICQQSGLVPIVAPEVLAEGNHGCEEAQAVLREILTTLVKIMTEYHVYLAATIVRVTAAAPGPCHMGSRDLWLVAAGTIKTLNQCLPPAIGGVFLARHEDLCKSVTILNHLQNCHIKKPFFVSFCYSLVIQEGVDSLWAGQDTNLRKARAELLKRAKLCSQASMGHLCGELRSLITKIESSY